MYAPVLWYHLSMNLSEDVVFVNSVTGCWEWTGTMHSDGYGLCFGTPAHRVVYTLLRGKIPEGLALDHLCRFRPCVNPDHMEAVTATENNLRKPERSVTSKHVTRVDVRLNYVSPAKAAAAYQVDPKTVWRWGNEGKISFITTPGGHRRYALEIATP